MQSFLWTLASLVAYIVGLTLIVRVTPKLLFCAYDGVRFMGFAALDILGALLTFGSIVISLAAWNANIGIRSLIFVLLVIIILVTGSIALACLRNHKRGVQQISRYAAVIFCLFLVWAALYEIVHLFKV
jgi:hypothetical protein